VLATQRHITGADEELPPCTVSGRVAQSAHGGMVARLRSAADI
jgi:hypothetical protein